MALGLLLFVIVFGPIFIGVFSAVFVKLVKVVTGCLLLNKAHDGTWWKGLIPFYSNLSLLNLGFNKKTAVFLFIADTASFVLMYVAYCSTSIIAGFVTVLEDIFNTGTYNYSSIDSLPVMYIVFSFIAMAAEYLFLFIRTVVFRMRTFSLAKAFNQEKWFCIISIFFPLIFGIILCFKHDPYMGEYH